MLVTGGEDTNIKVWDLRNPVTARSSIASFKQHTGRLTCLDLTADGKVLISGADDGYLMLWDMV